MPEPQKLNPSRRNGANWGGQLGLTVLAQRHADLARDRGGEGSPTDEGVERALEQLAERKGGVRRRPP